MAIVYVSGLKELLLDCFIHRKVVQKPFMLPPACSAVGLPQMERVATRAIHDATSCQQTGKFDSAPFVELVSSVRKLAIQLI